MGNIESTIEYIEDTITEQHIKEGISKEYVKAIAYYTGLNIKEYEYDYGIDGTFSGVKVRDGRIVSNGFNLDFQLKASVNVVEEGDAVKYNLEAKNYNDLVDEETGTPRILILYKLPRDKETWINVNKDKTIFNCCAWWCYLRGKEPTNNKEKKTIRIPKNQQFDEKSLKQLMNQVMRGELI
ncbi:hypothetical protein IO99_00520 [Clostridium sulfidigenes]|uniref:DUF4365 domain-containing protein n=1 Tax=Clostridium sulfidigenes TaxID=318464 RepID=A0A084JIB4_9CLOT|nr:DUF4365 domain-containing protein [Clostridium sulfidigenes]KEZ88698.1 hypothetical protein IO99_00520 [Clostridium sulfidigenes]